MFIGIYENFKHQWKLFILENVLYSGKGVFILLKSVFTHTHKKETIKEVFTDMFFEEPKNGIAAKTQFWSF